MDGDVAELFVVLFSGVPESIARPLSSDGPACMGTVSSGACMTYSHAQRRAAHLRVSLQIDTHPARQQNLQSLICGIIHMTIGVRGVNGLLNQLALDLQSADPVKFSNSSRM